MGTRSELRTGLRLLIMALVFLAMSCESDGDGDGCGSTDGLIVGCSDGCGKGIKPVGGDGCMGDCLLGSADGGGCMGDCLDLDSCMGDSCGDCGDCGDVGPYRYDGEVQTDAIQVQVTNSLFNFVNQNIYEILEAVAGDALPIEDGKAKVCIPKDTNIEVTKLCTRVDSSGPCAGTGCALNVDIGNIAITPEAPNGLKIRVSGVKASGDISASYSQCDTIKVSTGGSGISLTVGMKFRKNSEYPTGSEDKVELYLGGSNDFAIDGIGNLSLGTRCRNCSTINKGLCAAGGWTFGVAASIATSIVGGMIDDQIGAISCRACDTNADCGKGATCGGGGVCNYPNKPFGQLCQGVQLGADAQVDATGLLSSIDPSASASLGLGAWLGNVYANPTQGIGFGARLGAAPTPANLCVPARPFPLNKATGCRDGKTCPRLSVLEGGTVDGTPYHVGIGIAMGGLNQILWAAYSSGALCLSVGGDSDAIDGLDMLNTDLIGVFVGSLPSLTNGVAKPLMIQLRPQEEPRVDFKKDRGQGAELDVLIPQLALDFYTVVDQRYARVFTLIADIKLPLGVKAENNQLEIAIGDLADLLDPETITVANVDMISKREVESLVGNLPTVIEAAAGGLLGDDLIPPIELPEMMGIRLDLIGAGLTMIEESNQPAALGIFAALAFEDGSGGWIESNLEPEIASLNIDIKDPRDLRADLAARRVAGQSFTYRDLMPHITADMKVVGAGLADDEIEYAYSINDGPWSFWKQGPTIHVNNPILAAESKYRVRITARRAGDPTTGSKSHAVFEFVNDYTAPKGTLRADGANVLIDAEDNVYDFDELTMRTRLNSGAWSERTAIAPIDISQALAEHERVVVDVSLEDPSGNARVIRRTFGEKKPATAQATLGAGADGCSSGEGKGGLLAVFAFMGLLLMRRKTEGATRAASPAYMALAVLTLLLLGVSSTGCKNKDSGGAEPVGGCDPACDANSQCIDDVCVPLGCSGDSDCVGDGQCINSQCVYQATCRDADDCEYGHICKSGVCKPSECTVSDDCTSLSCTDGLLPFCDFDDYASVEAGECICSDGVPLRNYGSWLNTHVLSDNSVIAFAYNESYGDLMLGTLVGDGTFDWEFIDGVPDGPVVAPSSGHRNGVRAPGPDAGRYVSAVVEKTDAGDVLHAAYQNVAADGGATSLRYLRGVKGSAGWSWTRIDVDSLDSAGMFPTLALMPAVTGQPVLTQPEEEGDNGASGGIAIVYMSGDIAIDPGDGSGVQYFAHLSSAYAATRTPETADDFSILEGFDLVENTNACGGLCTSQSICLNDQNICVPTARRCDPGCENGQACVTFEGVNQCMNAGGGRAGMSVVPFGIGLFASSVVDKDGVLHVAYYDQTHGNLIYASLQVNGQALEIKQSPIIVDGESGGQSTGDLGRWANVHVLDDGRVVIFYEDAGKSQLRAAILQGTNASITVLDEGIYKNGANDWVSTNRVGSNPVAKPLPNQGFEVFYHDATDLVVRRVVWDDLSATPTEHPQAVFGTEESYGRDPGAEGADLAADEQVKDLVNGGYGFFVQVSDIPGKRVISSKRVYHAGSGNVATDVQSGALPRQNSGGTGPEPDPNAPGPDIDF